MNILIDLLPTEVTIDEKEYKINSNFRTSILFSMMVEDKEISEKQKVYQALELYYPIIPCDINKAMDKILWLYSCGKTKELSRTGNSKVNKKVFDYDKDSDYIYSAFLSQYKIDLQDIKYMHWWKFKALLDSLKDDNKLCEIIKFRSTDLNKIKDKGQKKYYKKMQDIYKLESKNATKEELKELANIKANILGI